jgi:hypothetical protein
LIDEFRFPGRCRKNYYRIDLAVVASDSALMLMKEGGKSYTAAQHTYNVASRYNLPDMDN